MKVTDETASIIETEFRGAAVGDQAGLFVMCSDCTIYDFSGQTVLGRLGTRRNQ